MLMGSSARAATSDTYRQLNLFGDVFERVRQRLRREARRLQAVESSHQRHAVRARSAIRAIWNAKSFRDMQVQTRGEFGGLGIEVRWRRPDQVVSPIDDTPASKMPAYGQRHLPIWTTTAVQGLTLHDLDAEAAEFAAGLHLHVAEALGVHIARMRIEAGQHAADG